MRRIPKRPLTMTSPGSGDAAGRSEVGEELFTGREHLRPGTWRASRRVLEAEDHRFIETGRTDSRGGRVVELTMDLAAWLRKYLEQPAPICCTRWSARSSHPDVCGAQALVNVRFRIATIHLGERRHHVAGIVRGGAIQWRNGRLGRAPLGRVPPEPSRLPASRRVGRRGRGRISRPCGRGRRRRRPRSGSGALPRRGRR